MEGRDTVEIYERAAGTYGRRRQAWRRDDAIAFGRSVGTGRVRVDLGCGGGRYTGDLGEPVVAVDAARAMLELAVERAPGCLPVQADLERLPFRPASVHGAWANMAYHHLPRERLPMALADLHWSTRVGAPVDLTTVVGDYVGTDLLHDDFPGRYFACWKEQPLTDVVEGAGFAVDWVDVLDGRNVHLRAGRARSLPDTVGASMRVLVCGLNPSEYAADLGVGYARPETPFGRAALAPRSWRPRRPPPPPPRPRRGGPTPQGARRPGGQPAAAGRRAPPPRGANGGLAARGPPAASPPGAAAPPPPPPRRHPPAGPGRGGGAAPPPPPPPPRPPPAPPPRPPPGARGRGRRRATDPTAPPRGGAVDLAVAAFPVGLAQLELLELAGGGAGQRVAELDRRRALEVRHAVAAVRDEVLGRRRLALAQHDQRLDRLAPLLVGHADHRAPRPPPGAGRGSPPPRWTTRSRRRR